MIPLILHIIISHSKTVKHQTTAATIYTILIQHSLIPSLSHTVSVVKY